MLDAKHAAKGYLGCFLISVQKYGAAAGICCLYEPTNMMHRLIFNLSSFWLALDDAWHETKGDPAIHSPDLSLSSAACVSCQNMLVLCTNKPD